MPWDKELEAAREAARLAGETALKFRQRGFAVEVKPDASPVTDADKECERVITRFLAETFPDDGVLGEEGARKESRSGRRWIVDPIDGTRDFSRGSRLWAILIGLETDAGVTTGVAAFPELGETFWAIHGGGAFRNDEPIRVSSVSGIEQAVVCSNGLNQLLDRPGHAECLSRFWAVRCLGGAPDAMLVASGKAEVWIEPTAKPWDLAPLKVIAEEAGARFFNYDGGASIHGGNCIVCVPALEDELRRFVSAAFPPVR